MINDSLKIIFISLRKSGCYKTGGSDFSKMSNFIVNTYMSGGLVPRIPFNQERFLSTFLYTYNALLHHIH
jgi:hypothetical protein